MIILGAKVANPMILALLIPLVRGSLQKCKEINPGPKRVVDCLTMKRNAKGNTEP